MGQLVIVVCLIAMFIAVVYGRKQAQSFLDGFFVLLGAFVFMVIGVGALLYLDYKKQGSETPARAPMPAPYVVPAAVQAAPPSPVYQSTARMCGACGGTGYVTCGTCGGTGYTPATARLAREGRMPPPYDCPQCGMSSLSGSGITGKARCTGCNGTGEVWY